MLPYRRYPRKRSRYVAVLAVAIGAGTAAAEAMHVCPQESSAAAANNSTTNSCWCAARHPAYSIGNELTTPTAASTCPSTSTDLQSSAVPVWNNAAVGVTSGSSVGWDQDDGKISGMNAANDGGSCPSVDVLRDEIRNLRSQVDSLMQQQAASALGGDNDQFCASTAARGNAMDGQYAYNGGVKSSSSASSLPPSTLSDAAAAGAMIGFFAGGGPVPGILSAVVSTYAATKPGPVGDVARSFGDLVVAMNHKIRQLDSKYKLLDRVGRGMLRIRQKAAALLASARTLERENRLVDKARVAAVAAWLKVVEFEREHRVVEELSQRTAMLVRSLAQVLGGNSTLAEAEG